MPTGVTRSLVQKNPMKTTYTSKKSTKIIKDCSIALYAYLDWMQAEKHSLLNSDR